MCYCPLLPGTDTAMPLLLLDILFVQIFARMSLLNLPVLTFRRNTRQLTVASWKLLLATLNGPIGTRHDRRPPGSLYP